MSFRLLLLGLMLLLLVTLGVSLGPIRTFSHPTCAGFAHGERAVRL